MDTCILYHIAQCILEIRISDTNLINAIIPDVEWRVVHNVKNADMACYRSPVYQRRLRKLFDRYVPSVHHLVPVIADFLGYDRVDVVTLEGMVKVKGDWAESLENVGESDISHLEKVGGSDISDPVVYGNQKGFPIKMPYEMDEVMMTMKNGERVKQRVNVGLHVEGRSVGNKFMRHVPFETSRNAMDTVWVGSQKPRRI